ncbi:uncharacterized protein LOC110984116 [Acanthaster planci]|uniref:Uncharacterized protein LOC110984116 n=1 Tax=Acanthaster planci TaxID=133434 RepID=A0A8B7Z1Z8_ACAPL|nr:uncharacterized protein LOC110984116 [Acanthaster planci]
MATKGNPKCCCCNVRNGSTSAAVFTMIHSLIFVGGIVYNLYIINNEPDGAQLSNGPTGFQLGNGQGLQLGNGQGLKLGNGQGLQLGNGQASLQLSNGAAGTLSGNFIVNMKQYLYTVYCVGAGIWSLVWVTGLLLLIGVRRDIRLLLLPYMIVTPIMILLEILCCALFIVVVVKIQMMVGVLMYRFFLFTGIYASMVIINVFCYICVLSQYIELREGRGRKEDIERAAKVGYEMLTLYQDEEKVEMNRPHPPPAYHDEDPYPADDEA